MCKDASHTGTLEDEQKICIVCICMYSVLTNSPHSQFCTENGSNSGPTGAVIAHYKLLQRDFDLVSGFFEDGGCDGRGGISLV